jgi:hypothetical protein
METEGPLAHWRLLADCRDSSGNLNHGTPLDVELTGECAEFDGTGSHIEVPDDPSLNLGRDDFTISTWIHTKSVLDDALGDIISKYDPDQRRGFNLCIQNFHGVTSSQSNFGNLFFGIDSGTEVEWVDRGRPGHAVMVWTLCVYAGSLYAGTFEIGRDQSGHVYRYDGDANWIDCGCPHPSNAVTSLAVFEGNLYAAASHYRSSGSALTDSENTTRGGRIFRYGGGKRWIDCGMAGESESIGGLVVFFGSLYASSMYDPPGLFRYEGGTNWTDCGNPGGRVEALGVYHGNLYGSGWDAEKGGVYRFDDISSWYDCGIPPGNTQTYSFATFKGNLHVGTWPSGRVFKLIPGGWEDRGRLGEEKEVMGMLVYNGKLYAGTLPSGRVYRFDRQGWTDTGQLDRTPDVKYRRAWSMASFRGSLFCGTLPSGHVYSLEAGKCISMDTQIEPGWQHIAVVRNSSSLHLLVNGRPVADPSPGRDLDISSSRTLMIGAGEHDYFRGSMRDLRIYGRALPEPEISSVMEEGRP